MRLLRECVCLGRQTGSSDILTFGDERAKVPQRKWLRDNGAVEKKRNSSSFFHQLCLNRGRMQLLPSPLWASVLWDSLSLTHTEQLIQRHQECRCSEAMAAKAFAALSAPACEYVKQILQSLDLCALKATTAGQQEMLWMLLPSVGFCWPQQVLNYFINAQFSQINLRLFTNNVSNMTLNQCLFSFSKKVKEELNLHKKYVCLPREVKFYFGY